MLNEWAVVRAHMYLVALVVSLASFLTAEAEPWLANRFAQNCAGCHAPGRKNLAPAKRRCTLSCQGCHVSPNGGGMRSHYGAWNEDRWLRSFYSEAVGHQPSFAPTKNQPYGKKKWNPKSKKARVAAERGYRLTTQPRHMNEDRYDRRDRLEFHTVKSDQEWLYQIPSDDPFRTMLKSRIDGGADLRWQTASFETEMTAGDTSTTQETWMSFLMAADLYWRWRPLHKKLHVVYEGRYLGQPKGEKKIENYIDALGRRSFYLMVDDLPYNTYAMAGFYRPLFGAYTADHTHLVQRLLSQALQESRSSYDLSFKAVSVGGSPNVPFANLHYIAGQHNRTENNDTHKGYAANLGGRFVTLGLSGTYSYWRTTKEKTIGTELVEVALSMHDFVLAGQFGPTTIQLEGLSISKDVPEDAYRSGAVFAVDTFTNVWRQMYLTGGYATANVADTIGPGSSSQLRIGMRAFLLPGLDVSMAFTQDQVVAEPESEGAPETTIKQSGLIGQVHVYL